MLVLMLGYDDGAVMGLDNDGAGQEKNLLLIVAKLFGGFGNLYAHF